MTKLRPYQQKTINDLYTWFNCHTGNPCISMPTGSGKSHIIAALCKDAIQSFPDTKILMLTHVKELIVQNAEKLRQHWPNAPLGIYSAGLGQKNPDQITFAGIQSLREKTERIGHIDLIIVDECHLISHKQTGTYRTLIEDLAIINPKLKVIGLTATPYRLGHGLITDKPAIFDDILEPVSIEELQYQGYLAKLKSKVTQRKLNADGVHKRGGEYIEKELQQKIDTDDNNAHVVSEAIRLAVDRKHWLFFCTGVQHAEHIRDILREQEIAAEMITGKTPKAERDRILVDYKAGKVQALTSVGVLTTGFDYPNIDLIVMMRPTMSPGLYVQMAGRGLRLKDHTDHCLVLDFAGIVKQHGPITFVNTPTKNTGDGLAPCKTCPECDEIIHASLMICSSCGYVFPPTPKKDMTLHTDDIQGSGLQTMDVTGWQWEKHTSRKSGKDMLKVIYFGALSDHPIPEYLCIWHSGYAGEKAAQILGMIARKCKADIYTEDLESFLAEMNKKKAPTELIYKKDGRWQRIVDRVWGEKKEQIIEEVYDDIPF